ncbi:MAG: hypothetical protein ISS51_04245 [Dehalococcoidales bacterium]|nr:hypothetical protein [Dehalococcoidales bacterium]
MKNIFAKYLLIGLVLMALVLPCACAEPAPPPSPAEFEISSLVITPTEAVPAEPVIISVNVNNTGESEGSYTAVLTVDGATIETKEVALALGASKTVSFSLVKDIPGTYQVGIGGLTSSLTVKEPVLVVKEIELKYDDGQARDYGAASRGGYLVDFSPPAMPFTIKKVRMCGGLWGSGYEGKDFEVEIWDNDCKVLHSATYPVTKFVAGAAIWVDVEVPDIEVSDKFYVHVYTGTGGWAGIHLGADDSVVNEHSELTIRTAEGISKIRADWPFQPEDWAGDKSKVNFMIRVVGTFIES